MSLARRASHEGAASGYNSAPMNNDTTLSLIAAIALNLLRALINAYGASVLLYLGLRWLIGERWTFIALINTFAEWLLLPAFVLLALALLTGSWHSALWCVPAIAAFCVLYGPLFMPRPAPPAEGLPTLRVMTYNLLANNRAYDEAAAMLLASDADVIGLQEYNAAAHAALEPALAAAYPHRAVHPQPDRFAGQAVYSRYPITEDAYWQYEWLITPLGHQRVRIAAPFGSFVLYNAHPTHPNMNHQFFNPSFRSREVADLLARIVAEGDVPLILLGDFNLPDQSDDYARLTAALTDSFRAQGWGMGRTFHYRSRFAFLRLDYIFHNHHWHTLEAAVSDDDAGSDHFPVVALLAYARP